MLAKLALVMQRLKIYLKTFCHDWQRWGDNFWILWGDTAVMRGHRAHGGSPQSPRLGKTLLGMAVFGRSAVVNTAFKKQFNKELQTPFPIENNHNNNRTIETKQ